MRKVFALLLYTLFFLNACKETKDKSLEKDNPVATHENEAIPENLKEKVSMVNDSMNTTWNKMIESDDQKFSDIRRLLQEVSYTSGYNALKHKKLIALTDSVYSLRYTQDSMSSKAIDKYDIATGILINQLFEFISETPEMESHTITETLVSDIQKADNEVVNFRVKYDRWAKEFNQLIYDYKDSLQQYGEPYSSFKSKPIFELPS